MIETWILISLGGIVLLLLMSAFFSGSETSLTAVSRARMLQLEKEGKAAAHRVTKLTEDRESLIGGILLGNNLVNILASSIATAVFLRLFGEHGVAYATLVMTALVLIFAEVLPKTYALSNPDRFAQAVSWPILQFVRVFAPVVSAVQAIVRFSLRLFGANVEGPVLSSHEELRGHIDLHHQEGGVVKDDRDMLGGVLDLRELTVDDVMVHRKNITMIEGDTENIIGVLHARDLARALLNTGGDAGAIDLKAVMREPWFVPETTELQDQLNAFREKREHFALVVDEYGALMGLVTLDDILEEIVGESEDEHDMPVEGVRMEAEGVWLIDGHTPIRDVNRALDWDLPDEEAVTMAGLVIHESQTIPETGQVFSFHGVRFEIVERRRNQIVLMRVAELPEAD